MKRIEVLETLNSDVDLEEMRFENVKKLMSTIEKGFPDHTELHFEYDYSGYDDSRTISIVGTRLENDKEFGKRKEVASDERKQRKQQKKRREEEEYEDYLKLKEKYGREGNES